jgi:dTDP-4-amino-4,6-dideoxygalactose transaminase
MGVPFLDLTRQFPAIRPEVENALSEVFKSQHFILGHHGKDLEREVAAHLGTSHAVGVASGTDALLLSLRALGLKPGEGVLTTSFTFFATAGAIHNAGGRPFFADIDPATFNLEPEAVRRFLAEQCTRAGDGRPVHKATGSIISVLLPVHLYGLPADMDGLNSVAAEYGLPVLEDACQAYGASYKGRRVGALGHAAAFSFFPTKNFGGSGDGGMITTSDEALADRLRTLRVHGSRERYIHEEVGFNSRLDEVQAAVLRVKLPRVDGWNRERAKVAKWYGEGLSGLPGVTPPVSPDGYDHIYHQYVIRTTRRDELKAYLADRQIGSMIYYPVPLHAQTCFKFLGYRDGDLPHTEAAAREVLALPVFAELTESEVAEVCQAIRAFHEGQG